MHFRRSRVVFFTGVVHEIITGLQLGGAVNAVFFDQMKNKIAVFKGNAFFTNEMFGAFAHHTVAKIPFCAV